MRDNAFFMIFLLGGVATTAYLSIFLSIDLWQIEALPDDASIISATEEKLRAHYAQRPKLGVAEVTGTALSQANVTFCPGEYGLDFGIITYIMYYTLTYEDGRTDTAAYSFWYLFE